MAGERPNSISSARRLALRSSIAAGATVVTLLGAQTLAVNNRLNGFLDSAPTDAAVSTDNSAAVLPTTAPLLMTAISASVTPSATPTLGLTPQPPHLVVVRQQAVQQSAQTNGVYQSAASGTPVSSPVPPTVKPTIKPTIRPTLIASVTPVPTLIQPVYIQPAVVQPAPRTRSSRR